MQVNGAVIGDVTPASTAYTLYELPNFTVTAGEHTIRFAGLNPAGGDNTALINVVVLTLESDTIYNGSFETPTLAADSFQYQPVGAGWQFTGAAGITADGSAFTNKNTFHRRQPGCVSPRVRHDDPIPVLGCRQL